MSLVLPPRTVIRVSRGNFDPAKFADVERMTEQTGTYLIPAISQLKGLLGYAAGASPSGSLVHVSFWESDLAAQQMASLHEMIVTARHDAEIVGVEFTPIVNYPTAWTVKSASG